MYGAGCQSQRVSSRPRLISRSADQLLTGTMHWIMFEHSYLYSISISALIGKLKLTPQPHYQWWDPWYQISALSLFGRLYQSRNDHDIQLSASLLM
jgi:hypothetical protein